MSNKYQNFMLDIIKKAWSHTLSSYLELNCEKIGQFDNY